MTYKPSGKILIKECEECHVNLNGKAVYKTVEKPERRLCNKCMAKYLDIKEFP